jgi:hypothetical protein
MVTCAGFQKLSRPIVLCHEMSQATPTDVQVTARALHHRYQGIEEAELFSLALSISDAVYGEVEEIVAKRNYPLQVDSRLLMHYLRTA